MLKATIRNSWFKIMLLTAALPLSIPSVHANGLAITGNSVSITATGYAQNADLSVTPGVVPAANNVPTGAITSSLTFTFDVAAATGKTISDGTYTYTAGVYIDQDGSNRRLEFTISDINMTFSNNGTTLAGSVAAGSKAHVSGRSAGGGTTAQITLNNSLFNFSDSTLSIGLGTQITEIEGGASPLDDLTTTFSAAGSYEYGVFLKQTGGPAGLTFGLTDGTTIFGCAPTNPMILAGQTSMAGATGLKGRLGVGQAAGGSVTALTTGTTNCVTTPALTTSSGGGSTPDPSPSPSASPLPISCPAGTTLNLSTLVCESTSVTGQVNNASSSVTSLQNDLNDPTKTAEELNAAIVTAANSAIDAANAAVASIDLVINSGGSGSTIDSNLIKSTASLLTNLVTSLSEATGKTGVTVDSTSLRSALQNKAKLLQQLKNATPLTADEKVTRATELKNLVSGLKKLVREPKRFAFQSVVTLSNPADSGTSCSVSFSAPATTIVGSCSVTGTNTVSISATVQGKFANQGYTASIGYTSGGSATSETASGTFPAAETTLSLPLSVGNADGGSLTDIQYAVLDEDDIGFTRDTLDETANIINANIALGVEIDFETVGLLEDLVDDGLSRALDAIGTSVDSDLDLEYNDPVTTRNLLSSDARLLGPMLDVVGINLVSTSGADQSTVEDNLESSGVSSDNAASLAADLATFRDPAGVSVGASSGSITGSQALINATGVTVTGDYEADSAIVVLSTSDFGGVEQNFPLFVQSTQIVSQSFPEGLSSLVDGRIVAISDGIANTVAPGLVDVVNFAAAIAEAGATLEITDEGNFLIAGSDFLLSGATGFAGQPSGVDGGTVSFVIADGDPASANFAFIANYSGGASQTIVPAIGDSAFYSVLADAGFVISTDRNTGIITIDGTNAETVEGLLPAGSVRRYRADFFMENLGFFSEDIIFRNEVNQLEAAFRPMEVNGDSQMDYRVIFGTKYQVLYGVP